MNEFPVPVWALAAFFILAVIYFVVEHYQYKKAAQQAIDNINRIFDGIKTFILIAIIERISSAFEDSDGDEDDDDHDDHDEYDFS